MKKVYHKPVSADEIKEILLLYHYRLSNDQYQTFIKIEKMLKMKENEVIKSQLGDSSEHVSISSSF